MSLIECRSLCKEYRRGGEAVHVLDHLDLSIDRGSYTALMGPSGSGKTTLLNLLAGIDRASSGELLVDGTDLARLDRNQLALWRSRHVGYVFQLYNLVPVLSAYENVELPLLLHDLSAAERHRRVVEALESVDLASRPFSNRTVRSARRAIASSWVTMTMVWPRSRCRRPKRSMTASAFARSRSPVGSSARSSVGCVTRARAIATRCSWPPESWRGRWPWRLARSTDSSASTTRRWRSAADRSCSRSGSSTFS